MAIDTLQRLERLIQPLGLILRGGFTVTDDDRVPKGPNDEAPRSLVLIGNAGTALWQGFAASDEYRDGEADPLDRWSRRVIDDAAQHLGAWSLYPFGGPPYHPFVAWAKRAEPVRESPLGILMHPRYGLWHAYRGALAFPTVVPFAEPDDHDFPCDSCQERPCLQACPVGAFTASRYQVKRCSDHISRDVGADCMAFGCRARRACPVGRDYQPLPDQAAFHMLAFRASRQRVRREKTPN